MEEGGWGQRALREAGSEGDCSTQRRRKIRCCGVALCCWMGVHVRLVLLFGLTRFCHHFDLERERERERERDSVGFVVVVVVFFFCFKFFS